MEARSGSGQTVSADRQYDAFGMVVSSSGTWNGNFGYAGAFGYQEDNDHGLKLLGHRYYDSSTGRFLTRDPICAGRNWYIYCQNDPISCYDVTGKRPIRIDLNGLSKAKYKNQDIAAGVAIWLIGGKSIREGKEYGGWIVLDGDNYIILPPVTSGLNDRVDIGPKPVGASGNYHIHPFPNGQVGDSTGKQLWGNSRFSRGDIETGNEFGVEIYLGDKDRRVWKWDKKSQKQELLFRLW